MTSKIKNLDEIFEHIVGDNPVYKIKSREEIHQWDSLKQAELIIALERKFNVRLSVKDLNEIVSYESLKKIFLRTF